MSEQDKPKHPGGRPTDYSEQQIPVVIDYLSQGYSLTACAGKMGVARSTLYEWGNNHPEFSDAIKEGRERGQALWETRLSSQALTGDGNTAAMIFAMKNLYQDDWREKQEVEHKGLTILLPEGSEGL